MILNKPVTITNKAFSKTITEVNIILIDDSKNKTVKVQLQPFFDVITLWEGDEYDAVGDYTQTQAENKIYTILGNDPSLLLKTLAIKQ